MLFDISIFLMTLCLKLHKYLFQHYIMSSLILQLFFNILISLIIIYAGHSLWEQLKHNYSTKRTKDLVNIQNSKYEKIFKNIEQSNDKLDTHVKTSLSDNDIQKLNAELEQFINTQTQNID
jgi:predicted PurR-regulated permease PerM